MTPNALGSCSISITFFESLREKSLSLLQDLLALLLLMSLPHWAQTTVRSSDGTFLYPYGNRMCYFDTLIEQF